MKREDVERLLAQSAKFGALNAAGLGSRVPVDPDDLRALCERWLAVEDAPAGRVEEMEPDASRLRWDDCNAALLSGQRVRIVPEGGGDGR